MEILEKAQVGIRRKIVKRSSEVVIYEMLWYR